jgi:hypothetical protein
MCSRIPCSSSSKSHSDSPPPRIFLQIHKTVWLSACRAYHSYQVGSEAFQLVNLFYTSTGKWGLDGLVVCVLRLLEQTLKSHEVSENLEKRKYSDFLIIWWASWASAALTRCHLQMGYQHREKLRQDSGHNRKGQCGSWMKWRS